MAIIMFILKLLMSLSYMQSNTMHAEYTIQQLLLLLTRVVWNYPFLHIQILNKKSVYTIITPALVHDHEPQC